MEKIFYSDLAEISSDVCPSSLEENLKPMDENNTAHVWDEDTNPVTCAECGTLKNQT